MASYFLDTSALVKRYVREPGSGWLRHLVDPAAGNLPHIVRIAEVEVTAALARRRRTASMSQLQADTALAQFRRDVALEYMIVEVSGTLLSAAADLAYAHALRGYDAVQLAAALEARLADAALVFVSADIELNRAARAEGLLSSWTQSLRTFVRVAWASSPCPCA